MGYILHQYSLTYLRRRFVHGHYRSAGHGRKLALSLMARERASVEPSPPREGYASAGSAPFPTTGEIPPTASCPLLIHSVDHGVGTCRFPRIARGRRYKNACGPKVYVSLHVIRCSKSENGSCGREGLGHAGAECLHLDVRIGCARLIGLASDIYSLHTFSLVASADIYDATTTHFLYRVR